MVKKKVEEPVRPKKHHFCFMEECPYYKDRKIDRECTIKICTYEDHNASLGCLVKCPKDPLF